MQTNLDISSLKQKTQSTFLDKITSFRQKIKDGIPQILQLGQALKKFIPIAVIITVLLSGLAIGNKISSLSKQSINIPKPAELPTATTPPPSTPLNSLKLSIEQLNPQLPDLIMPEFDDSISLQELEE